MKPIRVAELFAGVGGFRVGLSAANAGLGTERFRVVWSNQWEPGRKVQHASDVYVRVFGADGHSNEDVSTVSIDSVPDVDLVVGGFPCQDYSVATSLQRSSGLVGKKGVLWWEIHRILRDKSPRPKYLFLENVDRLLKSPATQRGRDFAVMLASLSDLGYAVEWRIVNAADYGMPQRRRRIFIIGYLEGTPLHEALTHGRSSMSWLTNDGVFAAAFPVAPLDGLVASQFVLHGDLAEVSSGFNATGHGSPFADSGILVERTVSTARLKPLYSGRRTTLGDLLVPEEDVPEEFFVNDRLNEWVYHKGAKVLNRVSRATGHEYVYSEGAMAFPDPLNRPSRTIITAEGGVSPSRFKHIVLTPSGRYRRLVPIELERLNMFPDDHTAGLNPNHRAFLMGNALVTGVVQRVGVALAGAVDSKGAATSAASRARGAAASVGTNVGLFDTRI